MARNACVAVFGLARNTSRAFFNTNTAEPHRPQNDFCQSLRAWRGLGQAKMALKAENNVVFVLDLTRTQG
jgi:hypothetical protein